MTRTTLSAGWTFTVLSVDGETPPQRPVGVEVTIPHDAVAHTPRRDDPSLTATGYFPGGSWEYSRTLHVPDEWRERHVALEFEAVHRSAAVYVNGDLAGRWANGYSSFSVPLDAFLRFGADNEITVRMRSHRDSRWYTGGGLIRPVHLLVTDPVHVPLDGVVVSTLDLDGEFAQVQVETSVRNLERHLRTRRVETTLLAPDGSVVAADSAPLTVLPGEEGVLRQRMLVPAPLLWSTETPHLHTAVIRLRPEAGGGEETRTRFGIRSLQLDPRRGLRLNGVPIDLRGACVHHDNGVIGAATIGRADERRVEILRAAGFNALRSAHQPMSRAMLEACDRLGMLVMDELSDQWTHAKTDDDYANEFPEWWQRDLEAMVRRDRTHPSVVAYSIGNEIPEIGSRHGAVWSRRLATEVRRLDPTRFVTAGVNGALLVMDDSKRTDPGLVDEGERQEAAEINGFMMGLADKMNALAVSEAVTKLTEEPWASVDIAGMNYLDSRYASDAALFPNRVIVGSETFPTKIDELWALVTRLPNVIGDFTWTGWDYLGEAGIGRPHYAEGGTGTALAPYPWVTSWAGDIDITGERRPASYYREIVFGLRAEPFIAVRRPSSRGLTPKHAPWSWSDSIPSWTWPEAEGGAIEVEVYSDADEVELVVNGVSRGVRPAGPENRYRAEFTVDYEPGGIEAFAVRSGVRAERQALTTASPERRLVALADRSTLHDHPDELAFIAVEVVDEHGVRATDVSAEVTLEVGGAGVQQAFGSGSPTMTGSYTDERHDLFDGRALAVVRPTGPGAVTVVVRAEGFADAELELTVEESAGAASE